LIVSLPWLDSQAPRVGDFVSNADVTPTILDALGIRPSEPDFQGRSLMPLITGQSAGADADDERLLYFETFYSYHHYRWSPLTGFVANGRKFIRGPYDLLYDLVADPQELSPLNSPGDLMAERRRLEELETELRRGRPATSHREPNRAEIEQLRALGYAVGSTGADAEAVDDLTGLAHPRDSMDIFAQYNWIGSLVRSNRIVEALEEAEKIAAADPRQKDARLMVCAFNARLRRFEAADRAFAEVVRDFPDKDVFLQAGSYFLAHRDFTQARHCFEWLVAQDPADVEALTRLGQTEEAAGEVATAQRLFEEALAFDPGYREALLGLAVLLDRQGSPAASQHFEAAAERFPFDPQVSLDYGVFLVRHGREREGVERLQQAATLSAGPLFDAAQLALATVYRRQGQIERARDCLREVVLRTKEPATLEKAQAMLDGLGGD
jgi:Tfp pilus assembly protein PilF